MRVSTVAGRFIGRYLLAFTFCVNFLGFCASLYYFNNLIKLYSFVVVLQEDGMNKSFENLETLCRSMTEHALEGEHLFA